MKRPKKVRAADAKLEKKAAEVRELERTECCATLDSRFRVGEIVLEVQRNASYGAESVERLAKLSGISATSLYRCASVAAAFSRQEIEAAKKSAGVASYSLTFSILRELSTVEPKERRDAMLGQAIEKHLSTRRLRAACPIKKEPSAVHQARRLRAAAKPGEESADAQPASVEGAAEHGVVHKVEAGTAGTTMSASQRALKAILDRMDDLDEAVVAGAASLDADDRGTAIATWRDLRVAIDERWTPGKVGAADASAPGE